MMDNKEQKNFKILNTTDFDNDFKCIDDEIRVIDNLYNEIKIIKK